jgi:CO dehydrogenase maturation factor
MGMGFAIAVSGKGGVGKTFIAAMLVKQLSERGTVLAIDADPDSNLPEALGVTATKNVGQARETIINAPARSKVASAKEEHLKLALHEAVEEFPQFDLIAMGRSEGEGCYCAVNHVIRQVIDSRARGYDFTVVDCHAGLEHLSRRTTRDVDLLLIVSDPTTRGLIAAARVAELIKELHTHAGQVRLVVNRVMGGNGDEPQLAPPLQQIIADNNLQLLGLIPLDLTVAEFDALGKPLAELPLGAPVRKRLEKIITSIDGLL